MDLAPLPQSAGPRGDKKEPRSSGKVLTETMRRDKTRDYGTPVYYRLCLTGPCIVRTGDSTIPPTISKYFKKILHSLTLITSATGMLASVLAAISIAGIGAGSCRGAAARDRCALRRTRAPPKRQRSAPIQY